ncbi:MAG: lipopolysaccharide heptosyltransferase II [Candidatus Omnitrophota bacterium]|nr:MAG: lipopolysaccharide heptosyltransferase II [Candidatus Omnitrophota bacterium]
MIAKILFITLSNIGDVILTLPVLDYLKENFPESKIIVIASPRPKEIFENNPAIHRLIVYDKHSGLKGKIKLYQDLSKENFDLVVDLRNTFFGAFLPARIRTNPFLIFPKNIRHMRDRHLFRVLSLQLSDVSRQQISRAAFLNINTEDEEYINKILKENKITDSDELIVIAAGARSHIKRWPKENFTRLVSLLAEDLKAKVVLAGDKADQNIAEYICSKAADSALDLSAKTNIRQLAALLKKAKLVVTNDSAILHLASYFNRPIVALFGPTDERKYGPWSGNCIVVKKDISCRPCKKAQCRFGTSECMQLVKVEDVFREAKNLFLRRTPYPVPPTRSNFQRILIVRTDRIGDVLLSTPVIKALRDAYPGAYLAMMVRPYTKEIIEGNPYLDEIIIYDKKAKHKSWYNSLNFTRVLRKKKFDLAIILHPTIRAHLLTFLSGIPKRLGYDRKMGFLLTDKIKHTKQRGEKHELDYNFDLLDHLGIKAEEKELHMPIKDASEKWAENFLKEEGIPQNQKLLTIHPGASCPSKIWPPERFAEAADKLIDKYNFKTLIIAGPKDLPIAEKVAKNMRHQAVNLAGKISVSQLASILKRSSLFISNDSGPVHIASALGIPVISIFGRNQRGLSSVRWGPIGEKARILHKEVGCIECLAHNCKKEFACLKAIGAEELINTAEELL